MHFHLFFSLTILFAYKLKHSQVVFILCVYLEHLETFYQKVYRWQKEPSSHEAVRYIQFQIFTNIACSYPVMASLDHLLKFDLKTHCIYSASYTGLA